jgi:hypothetical protein
MKIIKEHINEKFEENSDPIHDLNIGIKPLIINATKEAFNISMKHRSEIKIVDITIYSLGIHIHTNYPNWGTFTLKNYFDELFKASGLDKYLKKEIDTHYHAYDVLFMMEFKQKYELLFDKDIIININNYNI